MTESELRSLVREVVARRLHQDGGVTSATSLQAQSAHASHLMLPLARGGDADGSCIIEPAVRCNHCGYCLSYGH